MWSIDFDFADINVLGQDVFTVCCAGLKGAIVSKRSKLVLLDDIIKSSEDIENPEIRERMRINWNSAIAPTMFDGGRAICLGTRFRADDIHVTTFIPANGWVQVEQSAILVDEETDEERSYWPSQWSLEYLREARNRDPVSFSYQYQNKIIRVSEISIDPAWILRGPVPPIEQFDALAIGADLSSTERERSDYTAFALGGRHAGRFYILDAWRGRVAGNISKLDKLISMLMDWDLLEKEENSDRFRAMQETVYFFCEQVAYQSSMRGDFTQYIQNEKRITGLVYRPAQAKGDKLSRLRGVSGLWENKLITINQMRPMNRLIDEHLNFGSYDHDDFVDATVYCLQGLTQRTRLEAL
jgi:phage terminase large subunit-like protein